MPFPASFSQQRLWFLDQLKPGEPTYNMPYAMWLDGPLDPGALQRAADALDPVVWLLRKFRGQKSRQD